MKCVLGISQGLAFTFLLGIGSAPSGPVSRGWFLPGLQAGRSGELVTVGAPSPTLPGPLAKSPGKEQSVQQVASLFAHLWENPHLHSPGR